jgi:hypothetical protein
MKVLTYAIMLLIAMIACPVAIVYIGTCAVVGTVARIITKTK